MTPAHGPFAVAPMPSKNSPKAYGTSCICIQFEMVWISPINQEKKGTTIKTKQKLLPDFKIFNFSSQPDKEMRMTNTYCQINETTQNTRPGTTTVQANFNEPVNDCISRKITLQRLRKPEIKSWHLTSLSGGSRASIRTESSSIPANEMVD